MLERINQEYNKYINEKGMCSDWSTSWSYQWGQVGWRRSISITWVKQQEERVSTVNEGCTSFHKQHGQYDNTSLNLVLQAQRTLLCNFEIQMVLAKFHCLMPWEDKKLDKKKIPDWSLKPPQLVCFWKQGLEIMTENRHQRGSEWWSSFKKLLYAK